MSWTSAYECIGTYGSNYMRKAKMGARFQENIYFDENAAEKDVSTATSKANANSFSGSVSGSYGGFSAEVSGGRDASSSNEDEESSSESNIESVSVGGQRQFGQIAASGSCGELLGEENILFPVEYETEPLCKIVNSRTYPKARSYLEHFLKHMINQGGQCSKAWCSGKGM